MDVITLDTFIRDVCAMQALPVEDVYLRMLRISVRALEDLRLHIVPVQVSKLLKVNSSLAVDLPDDCVKVTKAAKYFLVNGEPHCIPLGRKDDMCSIDVERLKTNNFFDCTPQEITNNYSSRFLNYGHSSLYLLPVWGYFFGERYGLREDGTVAYFSVDQDSNRIVFEGNGAIKENDQVLVQYNSMTGDQGKYVLPKKAFTMLKARVLQWFYEGTNTRQAQYFSQELRREVSMFKRTELANYTLDDYINAFTSNYSSTAK